MLNKCGTGKFFIMELCDDIPVDIAIPAGFVLFSSMFYSIKMLSEIGIQSNRMARRISVPLKSGIVGRCSPF